MDTHCICFNVGEKGNTHRCVLFIATILTYWAYNMGEGAVQHTLRCQHGFRIAVLEIQVTFAGSYVCGIWHSCALNIFKSYCFDLDQEIDLAPKSDL